MLVHFVYNGDPDEADRSVTLEAYREDLESKKYLIDRFFEGRKVDLRFQFISNETSTRGHPHDGTTYAYDLAMPAVIASTNEAGEQLHVGFVSLRDLYRMYREMGPSGGRCPSLAGYVRVTRAHRRGDRSRRC